MTSTKLYPNLSVIFLKKQKDGILTEQGSLPTKALQAYREGNPLPKEERNTPYENGKGTIAPRGGSRDPSQELTRGEVAGGVR